MKRPILCCALPLSLTAACVAQPLTVVPPSAFSQLQPMYQDLALPVILRSLAARLGAPILLSDEVAALKTKLTITGRPDWKPEQILEILCDAHNLSLGKMGTTFLVVLDKSPKPRAIFTAPRLDLLPIPGQPFAPKQFDFVMPRAEQPGPPSDKSFEFNGRRVYEIPLQPPTIERN